MSNMGEDKLREALRALGRDMEQQQAPPQLEATLRLAFRQQHRRPVWRQPRFQVAVAAAVLLVSGVSWMLTTRPQGPVGVEIVKPHPRAPLMTPDVPVVAKAKPAVRVRKPRPKAPVVQAARARPQPQAEPLPMREIATDFVPVGIPGPISTADTDRIIRVRVPRSTMSGFGFPVNPDRMMESVKADVVLGDGGMVRAIRFVQ